MKVSFRQISFEGSTSELRTLMKNMGALEILDQPVQMKIESDVSEEEGLVLEDITSEEGQQSVLPEKTPKKRRK